LLFENKKKIAVLEVAFLEHTLYIT